MNLLNKIDRFLEHHFGGHLNFNLWRWRITIYGFNAMHVSIQVSTRRWGYVCFHPTMRVFGSWWPWYFYVSPNATPWASTFAIGPGVRKSEKARAKVRRKLWGHNFDTDLHDPHSLPEGSAK
jgi:hypothetical protein